MAWIVEYKAFLQQVRREFTDRESAEQWLRQVGKWGATGADPGVSVTRDSESLYNDLKAAGVPLDNHESDLYVKVTPESQAILNTYYSRCMVSTFKSQIDGETWADVPFAYKPFWDAKQA